MAKLYLKLGTFGSKNGKVKNKKLVDGNDNIIGYYSGETKDGQMHGKGELNYEDGDKYIGEFYQNKRQGAGKFMGSDWSYEGEWKDDEMNGKGKYLKQNDLEYDGDWKDSNATGYGKLKADNYIYEGEIFEWEPHGKGKMIIDEITFGGEWKKAEMNGEFKITDKKGNICETHFKNGNMYNNGKLIFANGDVYEGLLNDDTEMNGKGRMIYADGTVYDGQWKKGKKHGKGKLTDKDDNIIASGLWEADECISIPKEMTLELEDGIYKGIVKDKKPHGKGILTTIKGSVYEGEFKDGKRHGKGKLTFKSGAFYEGDFKDGKMNGKGIYKWKSGNQYEGDFKDGKMNGKGICKWAVDSVNSDAKAGDIYEGEWKDDKRNGKGKLMDSTGKVIAEGTWEANECISTPKEMTLELEDGVYQGTVINKKPNGKGILKYHWGDVYEGEFKNGKQHGQGKFNYAENPESPLYPERSISHEGNWYEGDADGFGKHISTEYTYEGEWCIWSMHGMGIMTFPNGDVYEGEFEDDKRNGQGIFKWANGDCYEGEWKNDRRNGKGIFSLAIGITYEGEWKDDKAHGKGMFRLDNDELISAKIMDLEKEEKYDVAIELYKQIISEPGFEEFIKEIEVEIIRLEQLEIKKAVSDISSTAESTDDFDDFE